MLLQNTEKPRLAFDAGKAASVDLAALGVGFGGFSPMALSDGIASKEQVAEAEARVAAYRESVERAVAVEAARASAERVWLDAEGSAWRYVTLDDAEVRITGCEPTVADVSIPERIEGMPVVAVGDDALAFLDIVSLTCPETVVSVGFCAFRGNRHLERAVLPAALARFDSDWLRGCDRLAHLTLPGRVEQLDQSLFDLPALRTLSIGAGTCGIAPGTFAKSQLESVTVDAANPFLMTDGRALYSRGGSVLVALAAPVREYEVSLGCREVAKKGFSMFACLERVSFPDGLEELGEFALSRTGITAFSAPSSLRVIGEKAFFNCEKLGEVRLDCLLEKVGDNAFSGSAVRELRLPASVRELGSPLAARTSLTYVGPDATFSLDEASPFLRLDEAGGLYRTEHDGACLIRLMDPDAVSYAVEPGTVRIGEEAFLNHAFLREVALPEGLREIAPAAFKGCRALVRADAPTTLERVGDEAFLDTNLARVHIPAALAHIGKNALVTHGAHHGSEAPSLREASVDAANERFYLAESLLLERKQNGAARVLLCAGGAEVVRIPEEVDEVAPYAFNDVTGIRELCLSDRIAEVGIRGLSVDGRIDLIHVDLVQPIAGHTSFELRFPDTDRGAQQMMLALSVPAFVDVAALFEHYDNAVVNGSSFDAESSKRLSLYDQALRVTERMRDPVFMTPVNRALAENFLRGKIEHICVAAAKRDDRRIIDSLLDLGFLNADNIVGVIERAGALQDAAMTNYLLDQRRCRFGSGGLDAVDFGL